MKTLKELAQMEGRVYVHITSDELGRQFLEQAEKEGFTFGDGASPTSREYADIMAINHNNTINYVGANGRIAVGCKAKTVNGEKLIVVEYQPADKRTA